MNLRGSWHKQTADGSDDLRSAEYGFSAEVLSENTSEHLRKYITPIEGTEDSGLNSWTPLELASILSIRMIRYYSAAYAQKFFCKLGQARI